ncbi:MAG TPA: DUF3108 domain-containing protein [Gemmatimonadaceae bacterium]
MACETTDRMVRCLVLIGFTSLIAVLDASSSPAENAPRTERKQAANAQQPLHIPFKVGERLTYHAKLNFINAGTATMSVEGIEDIRGHPAYHTIFDVKGKILFFHVDDHYESWFDTTTLVSLRHIQHIDESKYKADKTYDFYPERQVYVRNGQERPSVAEPLDEGSFVYFLRSVPLEVGKTYEFNRYYNAERNPVIVKVDRRERIKVPAGEFDALVLKPIIKSKGLFSESGDAEVWLADDPSRTLLRLKSKLPFGTLYLELKQIENVNRR